MSKSDSIFALVAQATGELRASMLNDLSTLRKVSVEVLTAEFEVFAKENEAKLAAAVRKQEREARTSRVNVLIKESEGLTLESENLGAFIQRVIDEVVLLR